MLDRLQPSVIACLSKLGIQKVVCGKTHCLAIALTGVVYGWGDNSMGQSCPHVTLALCSMPQVSFHFLTYNQTTLTFQWQCITNLVIKILIVSLKKCLKALIYNHIFDCTTGCLSACGRNSSWYLRSWKLQFRFVWYWSYFWIRKRRQKYKVKVFESLLLHIGLFSCQVNVFG